MDIEILENRPDLLQFQVVLHPEGNTSQVIAVGKEDTRLFLETLLDNLETDHPEFYWKNGLELSETQSAVCIIFYPNRLSEEA